MWVWHSNVSLTFKCQFGVHELDVQIWIWQSNEKSTFGTVHPPYHSTTCLNWDDNVHVCSNICTVEALENKGTAHGVYLLRSLTTTSYTPLPLITLDSSYTLLSRARATSQQIYPGGCLCGTYYYIHCHPSWDRWRCGTPDEEMWWLHSTGEGSVDLVTQVLLT